jgi:type I restriction enzyme S subunit
MASWPEVRLDECCEIVSGATPSTSIAEYWDGDICWATPKDLSVLAGAVISDTPRKITAAGLASCAADVLPPGSVLFSSRAPIGHVAINAVPMATNQGFKSFVPKPSRVEARFLYWWLKANRAYLESLGNGATFKEVSKAVVSRVRIPLPRLHEQRRIAEVLDRAEALRACRVRGLDRLKLMELSIVNEMFGSATAPQGPWKTRCLAELVREGDSINYGVVQPGPDVEGGVPLVRVGDLIDHRVSHACLKRIASDVERTYRRSRLQGDELLVSCVGSIGVVALATRAERGFNIARAVARVPLASSVNRVYIAAYLRTAQVQRYFTQELRTVSQPTLNIKQLSETRIVLPPLELQQGFAARMDAVDRVLAAQRESYRQLSVLFESMQRRAFSGTL